ncbi:hypothetical protein GN956_G12472, partial [Arapaima gigas]
KTGREKDKMERLTDREDISSSWNRCVHRFSKPGAAHDGFSNLEGSGNKPAQPLPLKCLFTGLPASEGSGNDESEREVDIGSPSMVFASFSFSSSSSSSSSSSLPLEAKQADKADLENMSTTERINFLQEKLRCIHSHYLSLKSEVALIDRKRKLQKKME